MSKGERIVIVIEYRAEKFTGEVLAEITALVRDRMATGNVAGAVFVDGYAAVGRKAYEVMELFPRPT